MQNRLKIVRKQQRKNKRASRNKNLNVSKKNFEERTIEKKKMQDVQQREREMNDENREKRKAAAKKREAKKARKEKNAVMSGDYQIIKKTEKIRRWNKKARKTLVRMSPEIVEKLMEKYKH